MNNEKTKSVLAYIFGLIGGLIVLMMKGSEKRTKICAAQSITIALIYYIVRVAYGFIPFNIPFFDYIVSGLYLVASIIGIVKACNDNEEPEILRRKTVKELIAPSGIDASHIDHLEIIAVSYTHLRAHET